MSTLNARRAAGEAAAGHHEPQREPGVQEPHAEPGEAEQEEGAAHVLAGAEAGDFDSASFTLQSARVNIAVPTEDLRRARISISRPSTSISSTICVLSLTVGGQPNRQCTAKAHVKMNESA